MDSYMFYIPAQFVDTITLAALRYFGGYTVLPGARGAWVDDEGITHYDDVTLVEIFSDTASVINTVCSYLFERGELAVAYKVNGKPYIINVDTAPYLINKTEDK